MNEKRACNKKPHLKLKKYWIHRFELKTFLT